MTESKSYLPWPGADDRIVVEEMLRDRSSGQWYECYVFVRKLVHVDKYWIWCYLKAVHSRRWRKQLDVLPRLSAMLYAQLSVMCVKG
jgi:hypothetical protein